jgi:hypothetical protein
MIARRCLSQLSFVVRFGRNAWPPIDPDQREQNQRRAVDILGQLDSIFRSSILRN